MSNATDQPRIAEEECPPTGYVRGESAVSLHRLSEVRRREGMSRRSVARQLGVAEAEVRRQECETTDLPLSMLHQWARVLKVPVTELVREPDNALSLPLLVRARMIRVMKTTVAIAQRVKELRTKRLAQMMVDQLVEIMPELRDVGSWPETGSRRKTNEYGVAYLRRPPTKLFCDTEGLP
jgi:transcriptional regulator with XRE-family HTH domain